MRLQQLPNRKSRLEARWLSIRNILLFDHIIVFVVVVVAIIIVSGDMIFMRAPLPLDPCAAWRPRQFDQAPRVFLPTPGNCTRS